MNMLQKSHFFYTKGKSYYPEITIFHFKKIEKVRFKSNTLTSQISQMDLEKKEFQNKNKKWLSTYWYIGCFSPRILARCSCPFLSVGGANLQKRMHRIHNISTRNWWALCIYEMVFSYPSKDYRQLREPKKGSLLGEKAPKREQAKRAVHL